MGITASRTQPPVGREPAERRPEARGRQVLKLLATSLTNRRIAKTLFTTEKTVSVHVTRVLVKLQVANRSGAGAIAVGIGKALFCWCLPQGDRDGRADEPLMPASAGWFRTGQHPNALASLGPRTRGTAARLLAASASCEQPGRAGPGRWP